MNTEYEEQKRLTIAAADANFAAISAREPRLHDQGGEVQKILHENCSAKSKLRKFYQLAAAIESAVSPNAACRRYCSACCHIAVAIPKAEAEYIGEKIGRKPNVITTPSGRESVENYFGIPCPFLKENDCSIYEHRPLACRLHFNIGHSPYFCNTDIAPENSVVPNINLQTFWLGLVLATGGEQQGDIREFFDKASV